MNTDYTEVKSKITELLSHGLVSGLGRAAPGEYCVEAAVSLALGETFSDTPSCVAEPDRQFAMRLNDAKWSSPQARAKGMLPLAIAQLGTIGKDRSRWVDAVVAGTCNVIIAKLARDMLKREDLAEVCERAKTRDEVKLSCGVVKDALCDANYTAAAAYAAAYAYCAAAAAYATSSAVAAAYAAAAADAALADVYAAYADEVLFLSVNIALDAYTGDQ